MRDRILILKPSSLGDVVQTLPALAAIRRGRPQAHISWAVNPEWSPLLDENPLLDAVHLFPRRSFRGPTAGLAFANWLRTEPRKWKIDTVLDFHGLLRSGLIARATGAERRIGLDDSREGARLFHNQVVSTDGVMHSVERYLRLAEVVGAVGGPVEYQVGPGAPVENLALTERSYLVLHPFSRGRGKSLNPADVGVFCRAVHPLPVVLVGRGGEREANLPDNAIDLREQTSIPELVWLLQRAGATVSVDSGPMHLAVATGRPVIGIHTWTDPRKVGPYRHDAIVWKGYTLCRFDELAQQPAEYFKHTELPCSDAVATIARRAAELKAAG
jgi:ADP-heptose:LPS heptosyltransferase